MNYAEQMVLAWQTCVNFNKLHKVGDKHNYLDKETQINSTIITTSVAYVVNDTPVVACNNRVIRLSDLKD